MLAKSDNHFSIDDNYFRISSHHGEQPVVLLAAFEYVSEGAATFRGIKLAVVRQKAEMDQVHTHADCDRALVSHYSDEFLLTDARCEMLPGLVRRLDGTSICLFPARDLN